LFEIEEKEQELWRSYEQKCEIRKQIIKREITFPSNKTSNKEI